MKCMSRNIILIIILFVFSQLVWVTFSYAESGSSLYGKFEKVVKKLDETKKVTLDDDSASGKIFSWSGKDSDVSWTGGTDETSSGSHTAIEKWIEDFYSKLVLETYKTQFKKNLKDLDATLKKIYPEKDDRIEAYKKIKQTYDTLLKNIRENTSTSLNKKQLKIYEESITYLIGLITQRIGTLEG